MRNFGLLLALTCLALAISGRLASAQNWIIVDQCDSLQVNGQDVSRIHFSIHDKMGEQITVARMFMPASLGDTCHTVDVVAPPGWIGSTAGINDGGAMWIASPGSEILSGQTLSGFQMTLSEPSCCVLFQFSSFLEPFGSATVCFACPFATPTRPDSWGAIKVFFR